MGVSWSRWRMGGARRRARRGWNRSSSRLRFWIMALVGGGSSWVGGGGWKVSVVGLYRGEEVEARKGFVRLPRRLGGGNAARVWRLGIERRWGCLLCCWIWSPGHGALGGWLVGSGTYCFCALVRCSAGLPAVLREATEYKVFTTSTIIGGVPIAVDVDATWSVYMTLLLAHDSEAAPTGSVHDSSNSRFSNRFLTSTVHALYIHARRVLI